MISPVREIDDAFLERVEAAVHQLEREGYRVYWPYRDTPQDRRELEIVRHNINAIRKADVVFIAWDGKSEGCLFDLGAAVALGKRVQGLVGLVPRRTLYRKTFANLIHQLWDEEDWRQISARRATLANF